MAQVFVETFEQNEVEVHPEACEEAKRLIDELGLDGQKRTVGETDTRLPYRQATAEEYMVYGLLCPSHTAIEKYSADTIPLRVLQVIAHAKSIGVFGGFEIWHQPTMLEKDPVLMAYMPGGEYRTERYLLARWGTELDDFPALMKRAAEAHVRNGITVVEDIIARAASKLAQLKACTPSVHISIPTMYGDR